ncbi:MAG: hypothetical protein ACLP1X_21650 [Polyangiaceae bacterium]
MMRTSKVFTAACVAIIAPGTLALGGCGSGDDARASTEPPDAHGGAADSGRAGATTDANGPSTEAGSDCASGTAFAVRDGATATVLTSNQFSPSAIAVDSASVYWTDLGPVGGGKAAIRLPGSVMKVPIGGGAPIELAANQVWPGAIAVDATNVYWTTGSGPHPPPPSRTAESKAAPCRKCPWTAGPPSRWFPRRCRGESPSTPKASIGPTAPCLATTLTPTTRTAR